MAFNEQQEKEYSEVIDEIAQLDQVLKTINGLGVSYSSNGVSSTQRNPEEVTKRLTFLRNKRNTLENIRDGIRVGSAGIGVLRANYWGGS